MGTNNLTSVKHNGKYVVAQYGQWDGYISGAGVDILSFLLHEFDKDKFVDGLKKCRYLEEEEFDNYLIKDFPTLNRDMGNGILRYIQNYKSDIEIPLVNNIGFVISLFCEWAYVVDLDNGEFRIFQGFNKEPLTESDEFYFDGKCDDNGYYPVKLIGTYFLNSLPSVEVFLSELESNDDKE